MPRPMTRRGNPFTLLGIFAGLLLFVGACFLLSSALLLLAAVLRHHT
jgi:hypothetical protein